MKAQLQTVIRFATLLAAAMLTGCASGPAVLDDWFPTRTREPLPARFVVVADAELPRICKLQGMQVYGCSIRVAQEKVCFIYTGAKPAEWLVAHEQRHCDGWEHSNPRTAANVARTDISAAVALERGHAH